MTSLPAPTVPNAARRYALVVAVIMLAAMNWWLNPRHELRWAHPVVLLPVGWAGLSLWYAWMQRSRPDASPEDRASIARYFFAPLMLVTLAIGIRQFVLLGLQIWIRFGDHAANLETERRILGVASSAVFLVIGNALPKILTPLAILPLHLAERVTSARRFIGTAFILVGLAMTIGFVWLPLELARSVARLLGAAAVLTVAGGIVWMNAGPARRTE